MTPEERRRRRLAQLASELKKNGESIFRGVVGKFVLRWGSKRETVIQYLEDLEWAGFITVYEKEDRIKWTG